MHIWMDLGLLFANDYVNQVVLSANLTQLKKKRKDKKIYQCSWGWSVNISFSDHSIPYQRSA